MERRISLILYSKTVFYAKADKIVFIRSEVRSSRTLKLEVHVL